MNNFRQGNSIPREKNDSIDMKTAKVVGVHTSNQSIRKQALSYIWAKYNMLPDNLTQSLGRLYDIAEETFLPKKNDKSLFDYTHDKSSVYSRSIAEKNLTVGENNTQISIYETPKETCNTWYKTGYQGKNYYDTLSDYNNNFNDSTNATYEEIYNNYESEINREYNQLTAATQSSKEQLESLKRPKKKDYENDEYAYELALKSWKEKKGKEQRRNKSESKELYRENLEALNSFVKEPKTLLQKTSKLFKENKIESIVSSHYYKDNQIEIIDTSKTSEGRSRGRNLLESFNDGFCRSWTQHNQYGKKTSLMRCRNITSEIEDSDLTKLNRSITGCSLLKDYSVLRNGLVKITPALRISNSYDTKRCMFAIENLAWKDVDIHSKLSEDQRGPNGGRIMWFPPYDLQFQESSQANWNETNFIGRGEPIYTYNNTKRTGSLSFTLLIDHPSFINEFDKRNSIYVDEENEDNDILRFFAGCEVPLMLKQWQPATYSDDENNSEPEDEKETVNESETEEITFTICFPYGYSGHYHKHEELDNDWWQYLFFGNDCEVDLVNPRGYEITKNEALTSTQKGKKRCFRIDRNENNEYEDHENFYYFIDSYANNANSKIYTMDDEVTYSFAHFITLFEYDDNDVKKRAKELEILDEDGSFIETIPSEGNESKKTGNLNKLYNLCKDPTFKFNSVEISSMWIGKKDKIPVYKKQATNRHNLLIKYIKSKYNDVVINQPDYEDAYSDSFVEESIDINNYYVKICTSVDVTLKYNTPDVNTTTQADKQHEVEEKKEKDKQNEKREKRETAPDSTVQDKHHRASDKYNEADYFKNLEEIDNFAYQKIKEKIKFFDPVYHSITPEGFNERLTFLHQCTRQGHTIERKANDKSNIATTASNMAFGRPPFCVLRIGDFINTKILIRNINIVYQNGNGMQWDMNPEGIGIQPMFAHITMQIEIIGGQALAAPVSRLNNAVSFNYYANTGVYDDRAILEEKPYKPNDKGSDQKK